MLGAHGAGRTRVHYVTQVPQQQQEEEEREATAAETNGNAAAAAVAGASGRDGQQPGDSGIDWGPESRDGGRAATLRPNFSPLLAHWKRVQGLQQALFKVLHKVPVHLNGHRTAVVWTSAASVVSTAALIIGSRWLRRRRKRSSQPADAGRAQASRSEKGAVGDDAEHSLASKNLRSHRKENTVHSNKITANGPGIEEIRKERGAAGNHVKSNDTKQNKSSVLVPGPLSKLSPTSDCVALADGNECVIRRKIDADNSCLFNAVGYVMHHSRAKAPWLRSIIAQTVSGDAQTFDSVFLDMPNEVYCQWIMSRSNWGGAIELSILSKHYHREIVAWNVETRTNHIFGEESGYRKQVMLIYNGVHYDALAIASGPKEDPSKDLTEFNPRTKRGKMVVAAAQKLVDLSNRNSKMTPMAKLKAVICNDCHTKLTTKSTLVEHTKNTGHVNYSEC